MQASDARKYGERFGINSIADFQAVLRRGTVEAIEQASGWVIHVSIEIHAYPEWQKDWMSSTMLHCRSLIADELERQERKIIYFDAGADVAFQQPPEAMAA